MARDRPIDSDTVIYLELSYCLARSWIEMNVNRARVVAQRNQKVLSRLNRIAECDLTFVGRSQSSVPWLERRMLRRRSD